MSLLFAIACGAAIGLVLGTLGGGGAILAVPALVYILGESPKDATSASLIVVGTTAALSTIGYHRDGLVRWKTGAVFGIVGIAASFAGTSLNRRVDGDVLLAAFAAVMAVSAVAMILRGRRNQEITRATAGRRGALIFAQVVLAGLVVGFLTGFLGVGGGFVVVPALVMILGYNMRVAAGTSLLIIALNSVVALSIQATHHPNFNWAIILPFTLAAIVAAQLGRRVAGHFSSATLTLLFAGLLVVLSVAIAVQVSLPLVGIGQ